MDFSVPFWEPHRVAKIRISPQRPSSLHLYFRLTHIHTEMADLLTSLTYDGGLIPVIVQDAATKTVLMLAYANAEAVALTKDTGFAHYYSRSRQKLWKKGEESGHLQKVTDIRVDCDADCLLYLVEQTGCACHEGYFSCFFRNLNGETPLTRLKTPEEIYPER